jgi:hypothetical protein
VLLLACLDSQVSNADSLEPSLVIIDTGIDSSLPMFQGRLITEVCVLDWYLCPNGRNFQEGPGAATLRGSVANLNGFDHGTQMASIAVTRYPQLKFIFIRIVASNINGNRLSVSNENVGKALEWVQVNREKFNIRAVSMSQGSHQLLSGIRYCPSIPSVQKMVTRLKLDGVAIFFPVGNQGDKKRIDWPACIPDSVSIGAVNEKDEISSYSNMDFSTTDMYALGNASAFAPGGRSVNASGTSVSTQIAAVLWVQFAVKHPEAGYSQIFQALRTSGKLVFDNEFRFGRKIDLEAALAKFEALTTSGSVASAS